ncbi:hypothetical protein CDEST_13874 [Colletotrichum destructivum]|uniref:Uncharacterized protein n=1 Tax=Colletotrichum destructivum TaxID=34406 RepID=A0AAX4J0A5_9PEZI|nr:hypothetical protein CDEST_13874 [Colletotrichum destructivum]
MLGSCVRSSDLEIALPRSPHTHAHTRASAQSSRICQTACHDKCQSSAPSLTKQGELQGQGSPTGERNCIGTTSQTLVASGRPLPNGGNSTVLIQDRMARLPVVYPYLYLVHLVHRCTDSRYLSTDPELHLQQPTSRR